MVANGYDWPPLGAGDPEQPTLYGSRMTLAHPFALQKKKEEEEAAPTEEITVVPRAPRSSYAFSHQEGYASLITQGTILRKSTAVHIHPDPMASDERLSTSFDPIL